MVRLLQIPLLFLCVTLVVGCGDGSKKDPAEVPVKGEVTLDGKPLPEGEITFAVVGMPGRPIPVANGVYSGKALPGKNKVEVRAFKAGPPLSTDPEKKPTKVNFLPEKYNEHSKLDAEVSPGGANEFKFDVTSR